MKKVSNGDGNNQRQIMHKENMHVMEICTTHANAMPGKRQKRNALDSRIELLASRLTVARSTN